VAQNGADILRLWVVGTDYTEDPVFGPEILKQQMDSYRRLRNTLRFLLGNLNGFDDSEVLPAAEMPELERWMLHRLWRMDRRVREGCAKFEFHPVFTELHNFCAVDLSAFYLDIRKDTLYCEPADSIERRAARTVLDILFDCLTAWLAPFACFTAEEAWLQRHPGENESVHLRLFPEIPAEWQDDELATKWEKVRQVRRVVTGALEVERAEKRIGSSLQACPKVYATAEHVAALAGIDLAEISITSNAELIEGEVPEGAFTIPEVAGVGVVPEKAEGDKCQRCYKVLPDVGDHGGLEEICDRCAAVVQQFGAAAE
jgi:isoleucyl-tRNA synthetase